jgi:dTDP-4-amino-4,6-dideoxygalactose transaminase
MRRSTLLVDCSTGISADEFVAFAVHQPIAMTQEPIPFLDLVTPHRELEAELVEVFREILRGAAFVGGPHVEGFEREFAAYCGTSYCVGVASGTDAVRLALTASGVGRGDAVVTVAHTFIATVEAISEAGAETEFVDIDPRTYCMSPTALDEYLASCPIDGEGSPLAKRSRKPIRAVLPVHLYGQIGDMDAIAAIAARYRLVVIEDACQAHGAEYRSADGLWRRAGTFGKAAAFSFYPGKNLGACGEAGAVTTNDEHVAAQIRMLRDHGQARKYYHDVEGSNGRLDAIQAAFLRIKLRRLDNWNASRREAAARYGELLSGIDDVVPAFESDRCKAIYHLYVIRTRDRDELAAALSAEGVATGLHYPLPVHLQACYREWAYGCGSLPETERAAAEILSLPMFPGLTVAAQKRVVTAIARALASRCLPKLASSV